MENAIDETVRAKYDSALVEYRLPTALVAGAIAHGKRENLSFEPSQKTRVIFRLMGLGGSTYDLSGIGRRSRLTILMPGRYIGNTVEE